MNTNDQDQEQLPLPHVAQPVYFRLCCHCGAIWDENEVHDFPGYCPSCTGKATTGREATSIEEWMKTNNKRREYKHIKGDTNGRPIK